MEIEEIAFNLSRSQLVSQKEDLRNLRNQASFSAAISGLIATVFAALAPENISLAFLKEPNLLWFGLEGWLVLCTFGGSILFSILVLISWKECIFELNSNWILDQAQSGKRAEEILSQLSKDADEYFDKNEAVIEDAKRYLWWSLVLSVIQIPAWSLTIF